MNGLYLGTLVKRFNNKINRQQYNDLIKFLVSCEYKSNIIYLDNVKIQKTIF